MIIANSYNYLIDSYPLSYSHGVNYSVQFGFTTLFVVPPLTALAKPRVHFADLTPQTSLNPHLSIFKYKVP
jgi:hypothetical protein